MLSCLLISGCGGQSFPSRVQFPTLTEPGRTVTPPIVAASVYKPAGQGPFPAVVVLHHCGGIDNDLRAWGARLAGEGYVSILPDSFTPRGVSRVCATGQVTEDDRVPDAYAAADYLRTLPEVRADRIGLLGFSHGAGTIAELVRGKPLSAPFRAAVAYYPFCRANASSIDVPTLILIGAKDDWTPAAPCVAWSQRVADRDKLNVVVYPDAYHKFDGRGFNDVLGAHGIVHHLQYDGAAADDANARTEGFLNRWLKQ
jgi:dienelactone hydrolase